MTHYVEVVDDDEDAKHTYRAVLQAELEGLVLEADVTSWLTGDDVASANIAVLRPFKSIAGGYTTKESDRSKVHSSLLELGDIKSNRGQCGGGRRYSVNAVPNSTSHILPFYS